MAKLNIEHTRRLLEQFDFKNLFVEELGWSQPSARKPAVWQLNGLRVEQRQIAQLSGVAVFEITIDGGKIPDAKTRAEIHKEISKGHFENLLIFLGKNERETYQSLWYWVKREDRKVYARDHLYVKGQPGDLFLSKLNSMVVDISELDEMGHMPVTEVADKLKDALDVERVTKKFYKEYREHHIEFQDLIEGIPDERDRRWYASVLLNRLMFIYFLQKKFFLDNGKDNYLQEKLAAAPRGEKYWYYETFLKTLFFEGFAKPEHLRSRGAKQLLGKIKYLNGGLFLPHRIEEAYENIRIQNRAFENILALFDGYSWNLNDAPGGKDNEINPDVLGYIFEKYINQKATGAYYTRPEITEYLCEQTIYKLILEKINALSLPPKPVPEQSSMFAPDQAGMFLTRRYDSMADLLLNLDAPLCRRLLAEILPELSILDPACGSGAFLVAAMKTLVNIYSAIVGKIQFLHDGYLTHWYTQAQDEHASLSYHIKKLIITNNLYGVDLMEEGSEIAKLRLFLALVASAERVEQLEPLPNIDFNILSGNALVGFLRIDEREFDERMEREPLLRKNYRDFVRETTHAIRTYRRNEAYAENLVGMRDEIQEKKEQVASTLNEVLADQFADLGIKFEQATWDEKKNKEGKTKKRPVQPEDVQELRPFHWGFEFDEIINGRGGFDAIITNPPWETFKPQSKEFFSEYSNIVTKNKMTIKEFEKEKAKLMKKPDVRAAWLDYLSRFPHVSWYFRTAPQYENQNAIVDGKKVGADINLYKLFLEQCFTLLDRGGRCGIIIPSGIYTDLGAKQLREMLFSHAQLENLYGLSNEKFIFEAVHHAFRFCLLTFKKGGATKSFEAAFRINVRDAVSPDQLDTFLHDKTEKLTLPVSLIRRLSPSSLSISDFRNETDLHIAEKFQRFPLLGTWVDEGWNLKLCNEFHMTGSSWLFKTDSKPGRLPLYEGKMIHQFTHTWGKPQYWLDEGEAREELVKTRLSAINRKLKAADLEIDVDEDDLLLDYDFHRLAFRDVAASTNERTMIATVLPPKVFCPHTMSLESVFEDDVIDDELILNITTLTPGTRIFATALLNSFVVDYQIRQKVTSHLSFFFVYNLPIPRLTERDDAFHPIMQRAARLICTTPEFEDLWQEATGSRWSKADAATNETGRARLRAELDGLIAHIYGLTEEEFAYILTTFPLVPEPTKVAAQNAYRDVARGIVK